MHTLTAQDRCDRCGARAVIRAQFIASELLFCNHHSREYANKLAGHITHDDRAALQPV